MLKRNRYLIDNLNYCICYNRKTTGGAVYTINYAKAKSLKLIYL